MKATRQVMPPSASRTPRTTSPAVRAPASVLPPLRSSHYALAAVLRDRVIQAQLIVSHPNDLYEQEADRVADQVLRMPDPLLTRPEIDPTPIRALPIQRLCKECEREDELQRQYSSAVDRERSDLDTVTATLRQPGRRLETVTRAFFEPRFGVDFSAVRIHTDSQASESAQAVNALAYTVGHHVVFNSGRYAPHSDSGKRLLAHELTHVLQQVPAEASVARSKSAEVIVARQPLRGPPAVPLEEAEAEPIPPKDRHAIELAATGYIPLAFTAFSNATAAHAAAIKNEAKAQAEIYAAVVDVATGFLAPVFANWVAGKLTARAAQATIEQATKAATVKLITRQDLFKAAFSGATKFANQLMKNNANALWGETEIDSFALALRNTFQRGAGAILDRLTKMKDDELLAVWTAYAPINADETAYRNVLAGLFKRYQQQIEPIGYELSPGGAGVPDAPGASSRVYEVQLAKRKRLANITVWTSGENYLWAWITPDMAAIARAKATALGLGISTIALKDVQVRLADIFEPPRPDLLRKDMLEIARTLSPAERQRAAADPDVVTIVETGREHDGRIPNQYERHKTLFLLRGFSSHAIACLDELDSWFPSWLLINRHLGAAGAAERDRLARDPWFVGRLRAELGAAGLAIVLSTLGLGPLPGPSKTAKPMQEPREPRFHLGPI